MRRERERKDLNTLLMTREYASQKKKDTPSSHELNRGFSAYLPRHSETAFGSKFPHALKLSEDLQSR